MNNLDAPLVVVPHQVIRVSTYEVGFVICGSSSETTCFLNDIVTRIKGTDQRRGVFIRVVFAKRANR